ncbi:MAG: hypothetical protein ACK5UT_05530, partial [Acidobacteriota bacterium]
GRAGLVCGACLCSWMRGGRGVGRGEGERPGWKRDGGDVPVWCGGVFVVADAGREVCWPGGGGASGV